MDIIVNELKEIFVNLNEEAKNGKLNGKIQTLHGVRGPELSFYEH